MAGIYLHIPFCRQACYYCDFHFSVDQEKKQQIVEAIAREIDMQQAYLGQESISTIYFGGGTPSLLTEAEFNTLFKALHRNFRIDPDAEVTVEANPDDLTPEKINSLKTVGVNRLSIGIQSFDDTVLQFLHRAHNGRAAIEAVEHAQHAGFNNISIDLIYAIPGQDDAAWRRNIEQAVKLNAGHISSYSLTIEQKTVFGRWAEKGKLKPVDDELAATQLEMLVEILGQHGYEQYEVSNFARTGYRSRHNSSYWQQQKYLGVGPSAHSYNGTSRQYNLSNNHLYLKAIEEGQIPFTQEVLTREDQINDYLLTTLRTAWGADLDWLKTTLGYDVAERHSRYVLTLLENNLATLQQGRLTLTKRGKLLADKISSDLFAEED